MDFSASTVLPVGLVCTYIKQIFDSEEMLHNVVVLGEISNLKTVGAYVYFNLKDQNGVLPCACFGLQRLEIPRDGDEVFVSGSLSFYPKGGRMSFVVSKIYKAGAGELMFHYQQSKDRLEKEGLFDERWKKDIPRFPSKVCVVTSKSGAVIRDIVRTIRDKNEDIDISVVDVRVQGEGAVSEIINGLKTADKINADVVILARGGGSWEDLFPFCEESVARAVFDVKTPIITAIGHETDTTLVDYVSDLRVATPTAAGELVTYSKEDEIKYVLSILSKIEKNIGRRIEDYERRIKSVNSYICAKAEGKFEKTTAKTNLLLNRIENSVGSKFALCEKDFEKLLNRLSTANPVQILKRGLFKASVGDKTLTDCGQVSIGDEIKLDSIDFSLNAQVTKITDKRGN